MSGVHRKRRTNDSSATFRALPRGATEAASATLSYIRYTKDSRIGREINSGTSSAALKSEAAARLTAFDSKTQF
jgi:hypothetical protein